MLDGRAPRAAAARDGRRAQAVLAHHDAGGPRAALGPARPRARRARRVPAAPAARRPSTQPAARGRCATPSSTTASAGASTPTARARSTRSSSGAARRWSTCGSSATASAACRPSARPRARRQPRALRGDGRAPATSCANDHFPEWFLRRPDQTCLQTWHGTPLKRLGFDVSEAFGRTRRFERRWEEQVGNWQYVLSPNRFTTPILRRAYAIEGELLEAGYPRNDVLAGGRRRPAGGAAAAARPARGRARRPLRADLPRPGARRPRPLPAGPAARPRAPAGRGRGPTRSCCSASTTTSSTRCP